MTVPNVAKGRGAWTSIGMDNRSRYYEYISGLPLDGSSKDKDVNYQAVNLGVVALQKRINDYGYLPALTTDGILGSKSDAGIRWVQKKLGLYVDGQAGPTTMKAIWRDLVTYWSSLNHVDPHHIWGMTSLESVFDPGAVGYVTPSDRGLCQINLTAHPNITVEQAYDPHFALNYTADRLEQARKKFSGKGADLQTKCSVAQHNSPAQALSWYQNGYPPSDQIRMYVERVLMAGEKY